jgi:N-acetylglucosaminyldiphosphoundecaprenol N-acetyl-beta-D-mannosaminyltransferase
MAYDMTTVSDTSDPTLESDDILLLDRRNPERVTSFLGISFAPMPMDIVVRRLSEASKRDDRFRYVVTPNVDHLVRFNDDAKLAPLYEAAWVNICDSRILEVLAKWSGLSLPVTPGSDLTRHLFDHEIDPNEPVVVIGADADIIDTVRQRYRLTDIRWHAPPMGLKNKPDAISAAASFMAANPARFHFLCVGSPQQELVALAATNHQGVRGVGLCVGASLDFLAGKVHRAPLWMQKARLEWLHRLISEPKRMWKRYLVEGPKIFKIWRAWEKQRDRAP